MIHDMSWMDVEQYLSQNDRAVVPLASTEQHQYLSLGVDNILAERGAREAARPRGVPVFPTLNDGLTPYFMAYHGAITLRVETLQHIIRDLLDSLTETGLKRVLFVNGHDGNNAGSGVIIEWMRPNLSVRVKWHNWWNALKTCAKVQAIDPNGSHASWMEDLPLTRLGGQHLPRESKPMVEVDTMRIMLSREVRSLLGDGNLGGTYEKPDAVIHELWRVGVQETREVLKGPWV